MPEEIPGDMTETPVLNPTGTLVLRPADLDDAESYFKLVADNFSRLSEWLHVPESPTTADQRRKSMMTELESVRAGGRHWWLIESGGVLAGTIDLHQIQSDGRWSLVGFWLAEGFTGRGIMTHSLRSVIDWGFSELGLIRIEIQSSIENRASCAVPERLGIRRESIRRQSNVIGGVAHDMASYVAFADNWPPGPPEKPLPITTLTVDDEILLRPVTDDDQLPMWQAIDDGRCYLGEFLPWVEESTSFEQHSSEFRKRRIERDVFERSATYAIEYRGEFAGLVSFFRPNPQNAIEMGYWLREDLQGRGIMTRSVAAAVNMVIIEMGMRRIVIRAATSNLPSRRIPERLGFAHEGTQRDAALAGGEYSNLEVYSILDHEWLARSSKA